MQTFLRRLAGFWTSRFNMDPNESTKLVTGDNVELKSNGNEATYLGEPDNSDEVVMRVSPSQPDTQGLPRPNGDAQLATHTQNGDGHSGEITDNADGFDALSPESLAPLMSTNQYTVRKMAAQALMDVALMMANISQLRTLISAGPNNTDYFYPLVVLVSFSLASQVVFAVLIFIIWVRESDQQQKEEYIHSLRQVADYRDMDKAKAEKTRKERWRLSEIKREEAFQESKVTNHLNYATTVLVFMITVINMFITGFGIKLNLVNPDTGVAATAAAHHHTHTYSGVNKTG